SKARYDVILPGWKACVAFASQPMSASSAGIPVALTAASLIGWKTVVGLWGAVILSLAVACRRTDDYFKDRARVLCSMKAFADCFVREFERPLIQQHLPHRPIEAQVRFNPDRSRLDVLLAPQSGLRYPNLTDHKQNVLYDLERIQRTLGDRTFVS